MAERCTVTEHGPEDNPYSYRCVRPAVYLVVDEAMEGFVCALHKRLLRGLFEPDSLRKLPAEKEVAMPHAFVPEPAPGTCIPIDPKKGEWRCRCRPNPRFDKSANPSYVSRCDACGTSRPPKEG